MANGLLTGLNEWSDFQKPIQTATYRLLQQLLVLAGATAAQIAAIGKLEPTCNGNPIETEKRKFILTKLAIDMLQSGTPVSELVDFLIDCEAVIPDFTTLLGGMPATDGTITATVGAVTINKPAGTAIILAGQTSVVVTNSLVTTNSLVFAVIRSNDATAILKNATPANGSFTIRTTAAVTANTQVGWLVINLS